MVEKPPVRLLDIAPKQCFRDFCRSMPYVTYVSSDLATPGAMVFSDLTSMGIATESFDIIICLHVFEHVQDDHSGFAELRRVLKPHGCGLLMVPLLGNSTFEDPNARPEDYERLYGQYDHVRWYGFDIVDRLEAVGLQVETIDMFSLFDERCRHHYALDGDDRYLFRISKPLGHLL